MIQTGLIVMFSILAIIFASLSIVLGLQWRKREIAATQSAAAISGCAGGILLCVFASLDSFIVMPDFIVTVFMCLFWTALLFAILFSIVEPQPKESYAAEPASISKNSTTRIFQSSSPATATASSLTLGSKLRALTVSGSVILALLSPGVAIRSLLLHAPKFAVPAMAQENIGAKIYTFEDLNFKFTAPPAPWIEMSLKPYNINTVLGFFRAKPQLVLQFISEKNLVVQSRDSQIFAEQAYAQTVAQFEEHHLNSSIPYKIAGIDGFLFSAKIRAKGQAMTRLHWMGGKNGFYHQIIMVSTGELSEKELNDYFAEAVKGFAVLDDKKQGGPAQINADYESKRYGYVVHGKDSGWNVWWFPPTNSIDERVIYMADYKIANGKSGVFLVFPVFFYKETPPLETLAPALTRLNTINYENIAEDAIKPVKLGHYEGYRITHEAGAGKAHYQYRLLILRGKDRAFFITAFASNLFEKEIDTGALEKILDRVEIAEPGERPSAKTLSDAEKEGHAKIYTLVGEEYIKQGLKEKGIGFLQDAFEMSPHNVELLKNVIDGLAQNDYYLEAADLLLTQRKNFPDDHDLLYLEAYVNYRLHTNETARKLYEELFTKEKFDGRAVSEYLDLMKDMKQSDAGRQKIISIFSEKSEPDEMIQLADAVQDREKPETALGIIAALYAKHPMNVNVRSRYFYYLLKYGLYDRLIKAADDHIAKYGAAADAFTHKSFALAALKRNSEALAAMIDAKALAPDLDLDHYINDLTAINKQAKGETFSGSTLEIDESLTLNGLDLKVSDQLVFKKSWGETLRDYFFQNEEKEWAKGIAATLSNYFGPLEVKDVHIQNLRESEDKPFILKYSYDVKSWFDEVGDAIAAKIPLAWETKYAVPPESRSEFAFRLISPSEIASRQTFEYPIEMKLRHNLKNDNLNRTFDCGRIEGSVKEEPGKLEVTRKISLVGGGYPSELYDQCVSELNTLLRNTSSTVILQGQVPSTD